jgi:hypothetical protein
MIRVPEWIVSMANPSLSFSSPVHHGKEGEEILITACRRTTVYRPKKTKTKHLII